MALSDLVLISGGVMHATATSTPANGINSFSVGIDAEKIDDENHLELEFTTLGPSITGVSGVTLSGDKTTVSATVTQTGTDQMTVTATMFHTATR